MRVQPQHVRYETTQATLEIVHDLYGHEFQSSNFMQRDINAIPYVAYHDLVETIFDAV